MLTYRQLHQALTFVPQVTELTFPSPLTYRHYSLIQGSVIPKGPELIINAIKNKTGDTLLVIANDSEYTTKGFLCVGKPVTWKGIHGGYELKVR